MPGHKKIVKGWARHFLPLLFPYWKQVCLAVMAMVLNSLLSAFRPWPVKVVIDRVLVYSHTHPNRMPFLRAWLDSARFTRLEILYGACAATLLIALATGVLSYYFVHTMGTRYLRNPP